ncbi:MAG: hypothetical protein QM536_09635, partial [Chitinophagaceae bacterium]|nr:hypothetical protein [Chitinophagaceae bacterium]
VQFFKQTYRFGKSRVSLFVKYPDSLKIVHILPSCFALFFIVTIITNLFFMKFLLILYFSLIFVDSLQKNKSIRVAFMSIIAAFIQLFSYGMGFIIKVGQSIFKS